MRPVGLAVADLGGWSVHPGGPRILDVVADQLGLSEHDMAPSRTGLAEHGNCSSPTVLMVLDRLLRDGGRPALMGARQAPAPRPAMLMAFGPGLTLYAALLQ